MMFGLKRFLVSTSVFLLTAVSVNAQSDTLITFSEIMFWPVAANSEFIELYNTSSVSPVDLQNFKIRYSTSSADIIVDAGNGTVLDPKQFAVIFEGDYDLANGIYSGLIPPGALVLKIDNNAFGSSGMSNSSDRIVRLLNAADDTLETIGYTANNSAGISEEKILLDKNNSAGNWTNSSVVNGTPGFKNSVSPKDFDLSVSRIFLSKTSPAEGDTITVTVSIFNLGLSDASNYSVNIYDDANVDSAAQGNELIFSNNYASLSAGDSNLVSTDLENIPIGIKNIIAKIIFTGDEDTLNNTANFTFTVSPQPNAFNDIVINEIMYAPPSEQPEWIELFNRSGSPVNLLNWKISDNTSSTVISDTTLILQPGEYLILSDDGSITNFYNIPSEIIVLNLPSLNNTGDNLTLKSSIQLTIDSVAYQPDWGGSSGGRSLERISSESPSNDPANWASADASVKATPGIINSVTPKGFDISITSFSSPKNFAVIGENYPVQITIKNTGTKSADSFSLKIYSDINADSIIQQGELLTEIPGGMILPNDSVSFDYDINNFNNGKNYLIAFADYQDDEFDNNNTAYFSFKGVEINEQPGDLIINEIMYAPQSPEPEWIEIFNQSSKIINVLGYGISDNSDTSIVIVNSLIINPSEYFIVAKDSSIFEKYNIQSAAVITGFPSLNNTSDAVVILDSLNRVIDSVLYNSAWGGLNGISLEKISPNLNPNISSSWSSSLNPFGGTPGFVNSVTQKDNDISAEKIIFNPAFPLNGDTAEISVSIKNIGKLASSFTLRLSEDTDLDSTAEKFLESSSEQNLLPGDSLAYQFNFRINNILTERAFSVTAVSAADEDTLNNTIYSSISPGFPPGSIVVNEIMYRPLNGEPEWVELYNTTNSGININGWSISDIFTTPVTAVITGVDFIMPPHSFLVVSKDSSINNFHRVIPSPVVVSKFANLNNDVDGIVLKDNRGVAIDSVQYNGDWGGIAGFSIERKLTGGPSNSSSNWIASADLEQGTPGRINSGTPKQFDLVLQSILFSPRFPLPGESVQVLTLIKNLGSENAADFKVEFYAGSKSGLSLLNSSENNSLTAGDSIILSSVSSFTLNDTALTAVRIVFNFDQDTLNNYAERTVVPGFGERTFLINEIMYDPAAGKPEWVELFNNSDVTVNLKNWSVSDLLSSPTKNTLTFNEAEVEPGQYVIVSPDTSFFGSTNAVKFEVEFGSLGNSSDGFIIYDFRDAIIDSINYKSDWGGGDGFSMERISFSEPTNDELNWTTSLSDSGSTPGKENSIFTIPQYRRNDVVINEIMFDPDAGNSEFIELYNLGSSVIELGGWYFDDENGNIHTLSKKSFKLPPGQYFLFAADSSVISNYSFLKAYDYINIAGESSLGLTNSGELILLHDLYGNVIDSVYYNDNWHNKNINITKNKSLERLNPVLDSNDPSNWSSSVSELGATPGEVNSIFTENLSTEAKLSVSPNPFSPDNDGLEDFTVINYNLTQAIAQIRIKVFDSRGRLVRTLVNNKPSSSSGSIIFDGLGDNGKPLRIGIYILYFEALNSSSGVVDAMKKAVVIARKL